MIVPCYNAASTLLEALQRLERQTFRDFEVLLVDDGSADDTVSLASAWCADHRRFRLIHAPHGGASAARNRGLAEARGAWVMFHDADDYLDRRALARLMALAAGADPQTAVVLGRAARVDAEGRTWPFPHWDLTDAFSVLTSQCALCIHAAVVRRSAAQDAGGFDESLKSGEDWDLWRRIARRGQFRQIPQRVAYYRSAPGSLSKNIVQLARDTLEVQRRGYVAAVEDAAEKGLAAPTDDRDYHRTAFLLWSAARAVAAGQDPEPVLALTENRAFIEIEPEYLADMLAAGMADYLGAQPQDMAARWPDIAEPLARLLLRAYPKSGGERSRGLAWLTLKDRFGVAFTHGAETERVTEGVCDLEAEPVDLIGQGEAAAIQLRRGMRSAGLVILPLDGVLSAEMIHHAAVEQVGQLSLKAAVRALTPWRSPAFWVGAGGGLTGGQSGPWGKARFRRAVAAGLAGQVSRSLGAASLSPQPDRPPIPVLMYHRVAEDGPAALRRYRVTPAAFEAQIAWLAEQGYRTFAPEDWGEPSATGGKPVLITFDDGYEDFAEIAWPILRRHGLSASVFVMPGKVGGVADWDAQFGEPARLMDWSTLRDLAGQGVSLGSHSLNHRSLTSLTRTEVERELGLSQVRIRERSGRDPIAFCYPFGAHDRAVSGLVASQGYRLAFTGRPGVSRAGDDPMRLPRIEVDGSMTLAAFAKAMEG